MEGEFYSICRSISLFGNDDVGFAISCCWIVDIFAIDEPDVVSVLLQVAGLTQVAHLWYFAGTVFYGAGKLCQGDDGDFAFHCQGF